MTQELRDPFETGRSGAPSVSLKNARKGDYFEGIILPSDPRETGTKPYRTVQKTKTNGEPLFFNADRSSSEKTTTSPMTHDGRHNTPIPVNVFTIQTPYRDREFMSNVRANAMEENGDQDNGIRQWYVNSKVNVEAVREGFKAAGIKKPEVGGKLTVTVVKIATGTASDGSTWEAREVGVRYEPPTDQTRKVVRDYIDSMTADDDPFGTEKVSTSVKTGGGVDYDEPPF